MKTERIRIGAFLTPLARRRPWQVARQTATLDHLSNGRLIFGAALGYQALDFVPFGETYDASVRAEKLDEGLAILAGLWSGERFSFAGQHYEISDVTLRPRPVQSPRIPTWVAAGWPRRKPLRRAARWDGVYLMTVNQVTNELLTLDEVKQVAAYVQAQRASADPFDIAVNVAAPADARERAEMARSYFQAGATWCIELSPDTLEEYRERIRSGPPKVHEHV
jgi:alkanesulfonate monooxygenase SsuD/methylene tetrahydromethanopterin reductase-like flavin-dependent oxidoreductase (luciferase family)